MKKEKWMKKWQQIFKLHGHPPSEKKIEKNSITIMFSFNSSWSSIWNRQVWNWYRCNECHETWTYYEINYPRYEWNLSFLSSPHKTSITNIILSSHSCHGWYYCYLRSCRCCLGCWWSWGWWQIHIVQVSITFIRIFTK